MKIFKRQEILILTNIDTSRFAYDFREFKDDFKELKYCFKEMIEALNKNNDLEKRIAKLEELSFVTTTIYPRPIEKDEDKILPTTTVYTTDNLEVKY